MAGIYIHIPYCRQACVYCDFHFSTSTRNQEAMWAAMETELRLRRPQWTEGAAAHLYFGGGTPSLVSPEVIGRLIGSVREQYGLEDGAEVTLEANPDDLNTEVIGQWKKLGINRLSLGIQSFRQQDLEWMHRAHDAGQAERAMELTASHFENYSIDLIYGLPLGEDEHWQESVHKALEWGAPHLSAYALTVEERTALHHRIRGGQEPPPSDDAARRQFEWLVDAMEGRGYRNYEVSNFALPGFYSRNNSAYWQGSPYLGIGPSAHSFDGLRRSWNVRSNPDYIRQLAAGTLPSEVEELSRRDRYNEYVMTGLRTERGVSLPEVEERFGPIAAAYLTQQAERFVQEHLLFYDGDRLVATRKGRFLVDGIASDLFLLNLAG